MVRFIPMIFLMGGFTFIGTYLLSSTSHFIEWTMKYNMMVHKQIEVRMGEPVLTMRAQANYARLKTNGGLTVFTWAIRGIGASLTLFGIFTICKIISVL